VSGDVHDFDQDPVAFDSVNDPKLLVETGRPVTFPFSEQRFISKPSDQSQTLRPRDRDDVLPFLVPLQDVGREAFELTIDSSVL
jgi:hypothetical protein